MANRASVSLQKLQCQALEPSFRNRQLSYTSVLLQFPSYLHNSLQLCPLGAQAFFQPSSPELLKALARVVNVAWHDSTVSTTPWSQYKTREVRTHCCEAQHLCGESNLDSTRHSGALERSSLKMLRTAVTTPATRKDDPLAQGLRQATGILLRQGRRPHAERRKEYRSIQPLRDRLLEPTGHPFEQTQKR